MEISVNYFEKIVLERVDSDNPREFKVSGPNRSIWKVLNRCEIHGKKIRILDNENIKVVSDLVNHFDDNYSIFEQFLKSGGITSFERDFSYGAYMIEFID